MKKNDAGSSLNFLWKFAAYTSLSWIAWGFSLLSVLRSVLLREYGTPWLNSWLLNDWRFFWTFICTNPQVASGSVCSPCPAFWQQMHHGMKAQKPAFSHVFGVWSDLFWHPIHPWACAEWDVQCVCNLAEWQLDFLESDHLRLHVVGDVIPLCFHGQSANQTVFTTEGKQKKMSTQLITSISQNQFPLLSTTSSHPQSFVITHSHPLSFHSHPHPPTSTHNHPTQKHLLINFDTVLINFETHPSKRKITKRLC